MRSIKLIFSLLVKIYWLCSVLRIHAALVNTTVDDTFGDPDTGFQVLYTPASAWNSPGVNKTCNGCTANPDPSQMYDLTWHDGTFATEPGSNNDTGSILSLSFPFNGSALYVYCALTFTLDHPAGNSDMQFFIDDVYVGSFELASNGSTAYTYNYSVYVNESIPAGPHMFSLESGHSGIKSLVMFDYLVYSHEEEDVSSTQTNSAPVTTVTVSAADPSSFTEIKAERAIGGCALAVFVALACLL